jgi:hypothetical protein
MKMNNFNEKIKLHFVYDKDIPFSEVLIKMNQCLYKNNKICIVEGFDDIIFYSNSKMKKIENVRYICGKKSSEDIITGKQYVLNACKKALDHQVLSRIISKFLFVVDRDYDYCDTYYEIGLAQYKDTTFKDKLTITKKYAFENYFLELKNLKIIFEYFKIQNELNKFLEKNKQFILETAEYFSWFATIVYAYRLPYMEKAKLNFKNNDIFVFDFSKQEYYNKTIMFKAIEERKRIIFISKYKKLLLQKQAEYLEIIKEQGYIQGHALYNFLKEYLMYFYSVDIRQKYKNDNYINILKKLDVDIELHLGNGQKI